MPINIKSLIFLLIFVNYCGGATDETKKNIEEEEKHNAADSVLDYTNRADFEHPALPPFLDLDTPGFLEAVLKSHDAASWEKFKAEDDRKFLEDRVNWLEWEFKMNQLTHKAALQNMMKLVNALIFTLAKQKTGDEQLKTTFFTFTDGDGGRERNVVYKYPDEWTFDVFDNNGHKKPYNYKWDLRKGDGKIVKVFGDAQNKKEIKVEEKIDVNENGKTGEPRMLSIDHPEIKKSFQQAKHAFQQLDAAAAPVVSPKSPKHSPLWPKSPSKIVNTQQPRNNVLPPIHTSPQQQPIQVQ